MLFGLTRWRSFGLTEIRSPRTYKFKIARYARSKCGHLLGLLRDHKCGTRLGNGALLFPAERGAGFHLRPASRSAFIFRGIRPPRSYNTQRFPGLEELMADVQ